MKELGKSIDRFNESFTSTNAYGKEILSIFENIYRVLEKMQTGRTVRASSCHVSLMSKLITIKNTFSSLNSVSTDENKLDLKIISGALEDVHFVLSRLDMLKNKTGDRELLNIIKYIEEVLL